MNKIRVGVVRGGKGSEFEVSLKTGANILKQLPSHYEGVDVLLTRDGEFHIHGAPVTLSELSQRVDVIWNALHGVYGEDGQFQRDLNRFNIPYTGSEAVPSALGMNKAQAKEKLRFQGIKMPSHKIISRANNSLTDLALELFRSFPQPSVVKPLADGSSVGLSLVRNYEELVNALTRGFAVSNELLIEEYVPGREATCAVIDGFRGTDFYALPPIEIKLPSTKDIFDYEAKYSGITEEICPGNFSHQEKEEIMKTALLAHSLLGLRDYSRSDMIVSPRGIYFLEVNTLPGLTSESLLPKALVSVGSSIPEFLDHVIGRTTRRSASRKNIS